MAIETVLFDLDDTLLFGKKAAIKFCHMLVDHFSYQLDIPSCEAVLKDILTDSRKVFESRERLFISLYKELPWTKQPTLPQILDFWRVGYAACSVPVDNLDSTLTYLLNKNIKIAVVTNGPTDFQKAKIKTLGLEKYFKVFAISDEVGFKKPDHEIYDFALEKLGAKRETAIFVGDNPNTDILGAFRLGLKTMWISNGLEWNEKDFKPDYIAENIKELRKII